MKNLTKTASTLVACPLVLFCGLAFSQADPAAILQELDVDGDGAISKEEATASDQLMGMWDVLDADANGSLSTEELAAMAEG